MSGILESVEFDYTPHYKTICDKKSHFSRVSDALAEFIDNSIQACKKVENNNIKSSININCYLTDNIYASNSVNTTSHFYLNRSFLVISDSGCGMTENELKNFAKYSFDHESRGIKSNDINERNNYLSKFGVGAKESGFFLGDRLRVITKSKNVNINNNNNSNNNILSMDLDESEFARKFEENESVYSGNIYKCLNISELITNEIIPGEEFYVKDMYNNIQSHINDNISFTIIILRLRPEIIMKLYTRYSVIFNELASIYHFYLHPEHRPNIIINDDKFQKPLL